MYGYRRKTDKISRSKSNSDSDRDKRRHINNKQNSNSSSERSRDSSERNRIKRRDKLAKGRSSSSSSSSGPVVRGNIPIANGPQTGILSVLINKFESIKASIEHNLDAIDVRELYFKDFIGDNGVINKLIEKLRLQDPEIISNLETVNNFYNILSYLFDVATLFVLNKDYSINRDYTIEIIHQCIDIILQIVGLEKKSEPIKEKINLIKNLIEKIVKTNVEQTVPLLLPKDKLRFFVQKYLIENKCALAKKYFTKFKPSVVGCNPKNQMAITKFIKENRKIDITSNSEEIQQFYGRAVVEIAKIKRAGITTLISQVRTATPSPSPATTEKIKNIVNYDKMLKSFITEGDFKKFAALRDKLEFVGTFDNCVLVKIKQGNRISGKIFKLNSLYSNGGGFYINPVDDSYHEDIFNFHLTFISQISNPGYAPNLCDFHLTLSIGPFGRQTIIARFFINITDGIQKLIPSESIQEMLCEIDIEHVKLFIESPLRNFLLSSGRFTLDGANAKVNREIYKVLNYINDIAIILDLLNKQLSINNRNGDAYRASITGYRASNNHLGVHGGKISNLKKNKKTKKN